MQHCYLHFCISTALLVCCGLFQLYSAEEFYDVTTFELVNFPPNNTPPSVEPYFCTNDEEDCKLDTVNGAELKTKWTLKVDLKKTSFSFEGKYVIRNPPERTGSFDATLTVDNTDIGADNEGNRMEPYALVTVTTTGILKVDDAKEGEFGDVILILAATYDGEEEPTKWAFGHSFDVGSA